MNCPTSRLSTWIADSSVGVITVMLSRIRPRSSSVQGPWRELWWTYKKASLAAGIGHVSTHSMRHTYRSWLDAVGTSVAVQQKLMRHADIRTTMNVYGDVVTDEMAQSHSKVVQLVVNGTEPAQVIENMA